MSESDVFLTLDNYDVIEKATDPTRGIQRSLLSEPRFTKVRVNQQASSYSSALGTPIIFSLPLDRYLCSYRDGCQNYFQVTMQCALADGSLASEYEWIKTEPWRLFDRYALYVNGKLIAETGSNVSEASTMRVMDRTFDWLASEGQAMGVDMNQGFKCTPFVSSQAECVDDGVRVDDGYTAISSGTVAYGPTGTAVTQAFGTDATPFTLNGSVKLAYTSSGVPYNPYKTFRIPLDIIMNNVLSDADSILPLRYVRDVSLYLYLARPQNYSSYFYDVISNPTYNWPTDHVTPKDYNIIFTNPLLLISTVDVDDSIDREYRGLLQEGKFTYRTQAECMYTLPAQFNANGQPGSISISQQLPQASIRDIQAVFICTAAVGSAYSGWKSTHLDNGLYQVQVQLNGEVYPKEIGINGYQDANSNFGVVGWDLYSMYNNARRAKLASEYQTMYLDAGIVNPWMYTGINHVTTEPGANLGKPRRGGYSLTTNTQVSTVQNATTLSRYFAQGQREFRIITDLASVTKSDSLYSGLRGGLYQINGTYSGLRGYYFDNVWADVSGDSMPTQLDATNMQCVMCVTYNLLLRVSRQDCVVIGGSRL